MKRIPLVPYLILFLLLPYGVSAQALTNQELRYALIIGNSAYQYTASLRNPANDAADVAATLQRAGFKVDLLLNANLSDMGEALLRFGNLLEMNRESAGFFFFAGHGIQSGNENYLLPVDQNIASEAQLKRKTIALSELLTYLDNAQNRFNMVVLDACRNNPFVSSFRSASRGLAVVGSAPWETVVLYATGAGEVAEDGSGRNSPFTAALLKKLESPGIEVETLLRETTGEVRAATGHRQVPYRYSNITRPFYFLPPNSTATSAAASARSEMEESPRPDIVKAGVSSSHLKIELDKQTILWKGRYYEPRFFSGYEEFLEGLEKAPEINKIIQDEIDSYRRSRRTSTLLQWGGLALVGLTGLAASGYDSNSSDGQLVLSYAGVLGGVVLGSVGMIMSTGTPKDLINVYNKAGFTHSADLAE